MQCEWLRLLSLEVKNPIQIGLMDIGYDSPVLRKCGMSRDIGVLKLLPNLTSIYLDADFDLSWLAFLQVLGHGCLETRDAYGIDLIDELADMKYLRHLSLRALRIEVKVGQGWKAPRRGLEFNFRRELERSLSQRIMHYQRAQDQHVDLAMNELTESQCVKAPLSSDREKAQQRVKEFGLKSRWWSCLERLDYFYYTQSWINAFIEEHFVDGRPRW